jgi:hypothetical protein
VCMWVCMCAYVCVCVYVCVYVCVCGMRFSAVRLSKLERGGG